MHSSASFVARLSVNPWLVLAGVACSIAGFAYFLYEKFDPNRTLVENAKRAVIYTTDNITDPSKLALIAASVLLAYLIVFSIAVRFENSALRKMATIFYDINRLYRQELQRSFVSDDPIGNAGQLLEREHATLHAVTERIAEIFTLAIRKPCIVSVKLVQVRDGLLYARAYTRSQSRCQRDEPSREFFEVSTGKNTGLDEALKHRTDSLPSHFACKDLKALKDAYKGQRLDYYAHYKSVVIVPIRGEVSEDGIRKTKADLIGFLTVDTTSRNRLGERHHIFMLAALANQMYNFICLMRGRYTVLI